MEPWKDWIPGVLSKRQLEQLHELRYIDGVSEANDAIADSSIDLTLSNTAFKLEVGAVKPHKGDYLQTVLKDGQLSNPIKPNENGEFILRAKETYVFKLKESLNKLVLCKQNLYGQATAKSTVGRMDVLARLLVDGMTFYEGFTPDRLQAGNGEMFLEITPMTFHVIVKEGDRLSQLRVFYGQPEHSVIKGEELLDSVVRKDAGDKCDDTLSVDLGFEVIGGERVSAFSTERNLDEDNPIRLAKSSPKPKPWDYWKFEQKDAGDRLRITDSKFYILRSKERLALTKGVAAYCRATDETMGEMRIHYAGFVHPYFGRNRGDETIGTPLIFEVRGHDLNVSMHDGEKMARLIFYRMSEEAKAPEKPSEYKAQTLQLSSIFDDWPAKVRREDTGKVSPVTE